MSLDDLLDRLIAEKAPPATTAAPATFEAPPASGDKIGESLSKLIKSAAAEHGSETLGAPPRDGDAGFGGGGGNNSHLATLLQQANERSLQQGHQLQAVQEELLAKTEQYNVLKDKTRLLVGEFQKLRESIANGTATAADAAPPPAPVAQAAPAAPVAPVGNFPWKRHLTDVQQALNKKETAISEAMLKVLNDAAEVIAVDSATRVRLMTQLATIRIENKAFAEAQSILTQSLALLDASNERKTMPAAFCLDALAQCHQEQEDFDSAEKMRREAVVIADDAVGGEHPDTGFFRERLENLRSDRNIANIGKDEASRTLLSKLTDQYNEAVAAGTLPVEEIKPADNMAGFMFDKYVSNGKNALAQKNMRDAESSLRSALDKTDGMANNDPRRCDALRLLASTLELQGKDPEAREYYEKCLTTAFTYIGWNDVQVAQSLASLAELHARINDVGLAKNYYQQSIASYTVLLGREHETVVALSETYDAFLQRIKEDRKWKGWSN